MKDKFIIFLTVFYSLYLSDCWSNSVFVEGKNGEQITLIEKNEEIGWYKLEVTGFNPGERIKTITNSMGEIIEGDFIMPDDGKQCVMMLPAVIGKSEGDVSLTVIGEKAEAVTLKYHWKISPKYLQTLSK